MANFKQVARKVGKFLKKNGYIFLIVICVAAIGTMIGVTVYNRNKADTQTQIPVDNNNNNDNDDGKLPVDGNKDDDKNKDDDDPIVQPISFIAPSTGTIDEELVYSAMSLIYNQTLNDWTTHMGVDFFSDTDPNVYAVCDGVVLEVEKEHLLLGNYVIIQHDEGYVSKYYSLGDDLQVAVGQTVAKGDVLGTMSTSMSKEAASGPHLHFEMAKNDITIDPLSVIVFNEK